jgi:hypothetical protein
MSNYADCCYNNGQTTSPYGIYTDNYYETLCNDCG